MYIRVYTYYTIHVNKCFVLLGCGKTLVARALANECSKEGRKVAFFMRKGADCLSKWVGESERQLRLLFDQVRGMQGIMLYVITCCMVNNKCWFTIMILK